MDLTVSQKLWLLNIRWASWVMPRWASLRAEEIFLTPQRVTRPDSEKIWYENAKKSTLADGKIAAYEWGPVSGPLVILLHGWGGRGTQMGAFAEVLVKRGFRVIAIDGPAHGASRGRKTNAGEFAQALLEIQKELGKFYAIVAHSFGVGCSVLAGVRGLKVDRLVLISGPAHYEKVVQNFLNRMHMSPRSREIFSHDMSAKVGLKMGDFNVGMLGSQLADVNALVVHDHDDKEVPYSAALAIQDHWKSAVVFGTRGFGHRRILKAPEVTHKVADFLGQGLQS